MSLGMKTAAKTNQLEEYAMPQAILRLPAVMAACGLSRSSIYDYIGRGLWPKPVNLGTRAVGWPAKEVNSINVARIAGKSNEEIRQLVADLEKARKFSHEG